jgi:tetratricopeptide (TPR) repeat protein
MLWTRVRILLWPLVLVGLAASVRAGFPIPEPPIPQRAALADAVVVGHVAAVEGEPVEAFPLLKVRGGRRVPFKMARVRVDHVLIEGSGSPPAGSRNGEGSGVPAGPDGVRVGVGPGRDLPNLTAGQKGCFFLHRHPEESFYVLASRWDFIDDRQEDFARDVALVGRCSALLGNPDAGLRSADAGDRLLTAAMLIFRFRTALYAYSGQPRTEPIDPDLSRRILAVLREDTLTDKAARGPAGRLTLFFRLGLTAEDGWRPPRDLQTIPAAAERWLGEHADTYRIRRYVPEEPMPPEQDQGPPPSEQEAPGRALLPWLQTALGRRPWVWVAALLVCVLPVIGWQIGRHLWAEFHCRAAEEALARSLRVKDPAPLAEAREHLACSLRVWPNQARLHFLMARAARRAGDLDDAARHLRRAEQLGWVVEATDLEKALAAVQQGDLDGKEPVLASFVERNHPDRLLILEALVQGCRRGYQLRRGLAYLDAWLEAQPDSVRALLWRGELLLLAGRNREALADYQKAVELDPDESEARLRAGDLLLASHQAGDALPHFAEVLRRHPDHGDALLGLARCQAERGDAAEAVKLLDRLLSLQPEQAAALAERGKIALAAGSPVDAEQWLRRAARIAPFERETLYNLARCLTQNGHAEEAEECLARLKRIDEDRKRLDELKAAILADPHNADLRCEMGVILLRNRQDQEGTRWLQSALREQPGHAAARQALEDSARR